MPSATGKNSLASEALMNIRRVPTSQFSDATCASRHTLRFMKATLNGTRGR